MTTQTSVESAAATSVAQPHTARAVAVSTVSQLGARGAHLVLNVVSSVILIRYMGPDHYGDYVRVIAVTGWVGLLSEFGLNKLGVRHAARDDESTGLVVGTVMGTRVVLSLVAAGLAQLMLLPLQASATVHVASLVASLMFICDSFFATVVVFQVTLKQHYEAFVRVFMEIVELAILVTLVVHHAGLVALVSAPVAAAALGAGVAYVLARRRFGLRLGFDRRLARTLLGSAAPIVPAIMIGVLTLKLDSLMVAAMAPRADVGLYGAAYQPIEYALNAVTVVAFPFFPLLARSYGRDREAFVRAYSWGTDCLIAFILPVTAITLVAATPMVTAVYDHDWAESARPLRLMSVALVLMSLSAWNGFVLLSANRQRLTIKYGLAALVVSLVMCLVLVPTVGYLGGAIAAIGANVVSAVWSSLTLHRTIDVHPGVSRLSRIVGANVVVACVAAALIAMEVPWWAACALAVACYPLLLWAFGVFTRGELASLRRTREVALAPGAAL